MEKESNGVHRWLRKDPRHASLVIAGTYWILLASLYEQYHIYNMYQAYVRLTQVIHKTNFLFYRLQYCTVPIRD